MKLSKRLETIASMIPLHMDVIDIGCDHGLLDIFLASTRKDIIVLGTDISKHSIENAKQRAKAYNLKNLTFVRADGLSGISIENKVLVLSGMGTFTILEILEKGNVKDNILIIGAHKNIDILRETMSEKGYYIHNEKALFDRKWYVILEFRKGMKQYTKEDYQMGPFVKNNIEYIEYLYQKEKKIAHKKGEKTPLLKTIEKIKKFQ